MHHTVQNALLDAGEFYFAHRIARDFGVALQAD